MAAFFLLIVMNVVATAILPRIWRGDFAEVHDVGSRGWWAFGEATRRGFIRGIPLGISGVWFLIALGVVLGFADRESRVARTLAVVFGGLFLLHLLIDILVVLFNHPKFVVPPHYRQDPGAVATWIRHLRHGR